MHVERKANNAIHIIREIKGLANISRTKLLRLYNSLVRSIIEYGCPVWQITLTENMKKLEAIQRKGLSICLGLPATSGREAMEVEGNILPVDLRIEEIAVREIAKIPVRPSVRPSGYIYMDCPAISSYSFGATALILCRMFTQIMEVCMSTGF
jgi:hypothetical protein